MAAPNSSMKIWDLPTRLVHWLLVVLIAASYLTAEFGSMQRHMQVGYVTLTVILFRIVWGLVGSEPSRFASFVRGPGAVVRYVGQLVRGRPPKWPGHNPFGALFIVAMLALLAVQASTGLFADDAIFTRGPLAKLVSSETSKWLTEVHETTFWALVGLILVHVAAAVLYQVAFRQRLVQAMITGSKEVPAGTPQPRLRHPLWALPALTAAAGVVWYVVTQL